MMEIAGIIIDPKGKPIPVAQIIKSLEYVNWYIVEI